MLRLDLATKNRDALVRRSLGNAHIDEIRAAIVTRDFLEPRQGHVDRAVLQHRLAVHDAGDHELAGFYLQLVARFFAEDLGRQFSEDHGILLRIARQTPFDDLQLVPSERIPLPPVDDHHGRVLHAEHLHESHVGLGHAGHGCDPVPHRLLESLGHDAALHVADHDVDADRVELIDHALLVAGRHADQRDDGGDADGDAEDGEPGAHRAAPQTTEDDLETIHRYEPSGTISPSLIRTVRVPWRASS